MTKRKSLIVIAVVCLLAIVMLWLFIPAGAPKTDTARYERWQHTATLGGRFYWWESHLPKSLDTLFRLPALDKKNWDEHERLGDALVASGYMTNVAIAVASLPTNEMQRAQIVARLHKTFQGRDEWEFYVSGHRKAVVVTCRPQDEVLCRQALQDD